MLVARVGLMVLAVVAISGGLLMVASGAMPRGFFVVASSAGPLWLQNFVASRGGLDDDGDRDDATRYR